MTKLRLAQMQLERTQMAWDPPDWADLAHYGFHALENAVDAACLHLALPFHRNHPARQLAAARLHLEHGLADVSDLLQDLNETRKSEAYGDVAAPELDAEQTVNEIEEYVESVAVLIGS